MGKLIVQKIVGELKVIKNKARSLSVWSGIKHCSNMIIIPCYSESKGIEIIEKIKNSTL